MEVLMSSNQVKLCPTCQTSSPVLSRFCINCGQKFEEENKRICPNCQAINNLDFKFCSNCGYVLSEAQETPSSCTTPDQASPTFTPQAPRTDSHWQPGQARQYGTTQQHVHPQPAPKKTIPLPKNALKVVLGVLAVVVLIVVLSLIIGGGRKITARNIEKIQRIESISLEDARKIAFDQNGQYFVYATRNDEIFVYSLRDGQLVTKIETEDSIDSIAISPNGKWLAAGIDDSDLYIWDIENGEQRKVLPSQSDVVDIAWSPDNKKLAVCYYNDDLLLWDIQSAKRATLNDDCEDLTWSSTGKYILYGDENETMGSFNDPVLIDVSRKSVLELPSNARGDVKDALFSPDGKSLIYNTYDGNKIYIWDFKSKEAREFVSKFDYISGQSFSPDSSKFLMLESGDNHFELQIWNAPSFKGLNTIASPTRRISGFYWLPDSKTFILLADKNVDIYNSKNGEQLASFENESNKLFSLSPDGKLTSTINGDDVLFWNVANGKEIFSMPNSRRGYEAILWLKDGTGFLAITDDAIEIWRLP